MGRIRTVEPLAGAHADEVESARAHLDGLLIASRALAAASGHDPDVVACTDAGCRLVTTPAGADLCTLAHRLATLRDTRPASVPSLATALTEFVHALTDALDAVRACRRTAHANGACWFTNSPGSDGCADVLRLAHRVG